MCHVISHLYKIFLTSVSKQFNIFIMIKFYSILTLTRHCFKIPVSSLSLYFYLPHISIFHTILILIIYVFPLKLETFTGIFTNSTPNYSININNSPDIASPLNPQSPS